MVEEATGATGDSIADAVQAGLDEQNGLEASEAGEDRIPETPIDETPGEETPETPELEASDEPTEQEVIDALSAPEHWSEEYQSAFNKVDRDTQEAWLEQHKHFQRGFDSMSQEYKQYRDQYSPYEGALRTIRESEPYWQAQGMGVEQGIGQLVQWGRYLAQSPADALPQIAKLYGVELDSLVAEQPFLTAEDRQRDQAMSAQEQRLNQMQQQLQQQEENKALSTIDSFRNEIEADGSPKHPYFDQVAQQITQIYESGWQGPLEQAYESAVWNDPTIRSELIAAQSAADKGGSQPTADQARRVEGKSQQRVRHAQTPPPVGTELDDMTTEQLVNHMARQQESAAAAR